MNLPARLALVATLLLTACAAPLPPAPRPAPPDKGPVPDALPAGVIAVPGEVPPAEAARNFLTVVERVAPVITAFCETKALPGTNCAFRIVLDDAVNAPPNAFQTLDQQGRPVIIFTIPLIAQTRNQDELAFVLAHEAAHHIEGHLEQQRRNAAVGANVLGGLVGLSNDPGVVRSAQQLGAVLGARTYSKEFELEADILGTRITALAGYDPLRGAEFFWRIPDPGDRFLGTHPANADRLAAVQRTVAGL